MHAILQHMGFYHTTENPCVKMRVNRKTKSCECIIIHTLKEILHIVKEKYKIKIIFQNCFQFILKIKTKCQKISS